MASNNSKKDENGRNSITCASSTNGTDIVIVCANPSNHGLCVDDNTTGSDNGNNGGNAMIDENNVAVWYALSSVDGTSLVEVYADPLTNKILINSN